MERATRRPGRWLAALACALLLGQSLAVAHAFDAEAHADERACDLCHVANELTGGAPAIGDVPQVAGSVCAPIIPPRFPVAARDASLPPPSRAPPSHLAIR